MLDVIIVGAGPIGLACGIEAKKRGLSYHIFEKETIVNAIYNYPLNMSFFSTSDKLEIGSVPFISHNPKPTRVEALEYYRRVVADQQLAIDCYEAISEVTRQENHFKLKTEKGRYFNCKNVILAMGFYDTPRLIGIEGEDLPKVFHYYKESHPFFGTDLAIIGSGNSAVDAALENLRKGAKSVTMIIREKEIGDNIKYWVRPDIINRIEENQIKAYFSSEVVKITNHTITAKTPNGTIHIKNDFVLALTGYQPNYRFLEKLGITFHEDEYRTPVYQQETMESNISGIYLAGVLCGGYKTNKWFIENSRTHANSIMDNIKKKKKVLKKESMSAL